MPYMLDLIGRVSFPIYAYLIAQGCKYTKDINKYLLRLGIFALISEIPFDIAFMHRVTNDEFNLNINFLDSTNVFYTLFFGVACIIIYERAKTRQRPWIILLPVLVVPLAFLLAIYLETIYDRLDVMPIMAISIFLYLAAALWLGYILSERASDEKCGLLRKSLAILLTIPVMLLGSVLSTDYGMWGIIYIFFIYMMKPENRVTRTIAMFSVVFLEYAYPYIYSRYIDLGISLFTLPGEMMQFTDNLHEFFFAFIAVILICLYDGKQGPKVKWAFYIFYPAHIAVLAAVWLFFIRI